MQKMSCFLRRLIAKTTPQDMAAGRAGGTVTVNKSSILSIKIAKGTPIETSCGIVATLAARAMIAIIPTNLSPSV